MVGQKPLSTRSSGNSLAMFRAKTALSSLLRQFTRYVSSKNRSQLAPPAIHSLCFEQKPLSTRSSGNSLAMFRAKTALNSLLRQFTRYVSSKNRSQLAPPAIHSLCFEQKPLSTRSSGNSLAMFRAQIALNSLLRQFTRYVSGTNRPQLAPPAIHSLCFGHKSPSTRSSGNSLAMFRAQIALNSLLRQFTRYVSGTNRPQICWTFRIGSRNSLVRSSWA